MIKGSITVYFSLMFCVMVIVCGVIIDVCRYDITQAKVSRDINLAVDFLASEFDQSM